MMRTEEIEDAPNILTGAFSIKTQLIDVHSMLSRYLISIWFLA